MKQRLAILSNIYVRIAAAVIGISALAIGAFALLSRRQREPSPAIAEAAAIALPLPQSGVVSPAVTLPEQAKWRTPAARGLGLISILLLIDVIYQLQPGIVTTVPPTLIIGLIGLAAAFSLAPQLLNSMSVTPTYQERIRDKSKTSAFLHPILTLLGIGSLVLLVASNMPEMRLSLSSHLQLVLLAAGVIWVAAGLGGIHRRDLHIDRRELYIMLALGVFAFILRFWMVEGALRFFVDELNFSNHVLRAWHVPDVPLLWRFDSIAAFPWLYPYLEAFGVYIFGRNLTGLRVVSTIFGALTVPALYSLARALFDRKTALAAAVLLATLPPHLHFSRLALNNIADPLFGTLALGWLAWGFRSGKRMFFGLAGVALGLTQYFYDGGRLLYPPLVALWLAACLILYLIDRWRGKQSIHWPLGGVIVMIIAFLIVALPVYIPVMVENASFSSRFDTEAAVVTVPQTEASNLVTQMPLRLWHTFIFYISLYDQSYFYGGDTALLLVYVAVAFLLGIAYVLWRVRYYGGILLLLWLAGTAFGNALIQNPTNSARYVVIFPGLALLAALGLRAALSLLIANERLQKYLWTALLIVFAVGQTYYYFGPHLTRYLAESRVYNDSQDAAFRAADFPTYTQMHLVAPPHELQYHGYARGVLGFIRDDMIFTVLSDEEFNSEYLESLPHHVDHAFFLLPDDTVSLERLQRYFNVSGPTYSPFDVPMNRQFALYYAAQEDN